MLYETKLSYDLLGFTMNDMHRSSVRSTTASYRDSTSVPTRMMQWLAHSTASKDYQFIDFNPGTIVVELC